MSPWWPLLGLRWFALRPWLWLQPLLAHVLALLALLAVGIATTWWAWPDDGAWWSVLLRACAAISLGVVAALAAWSVIVPLLLALVLDQLAETVFTARGFPPLAVPIARSLRDGFAVLLRTLPFRLRWLGVGLTALFLGPLGPLVAAYALARVAVVDALDIAASVRGSSVESRLLTYAMQRQALRRSAAVAGGLQIALACTLVGWFFWLPGLVCGAALMLEDSRPSQLRGSSDEVAT
jgi:hypothetical protein